MLSYNHLVQDNKKLQEITTEYLSFEWLHFRALYTTQTVNWQLTDA